MVSIRCREVKPEVLPVGLNGEESEDWSLVVGPEVAGQGFYNVRDKAIHGRWNSLVVSMFDISSLGLRRYADLYC